MMSYTLNAVARSAEEQGKGASRRLRKENLIPAIIYGGESEAVSICVKTNELVKAISEDAFFSSIIGIELDGTKQEVIIKALQRHPSKGFPLHADFQRIVRGQEMNFSVPVRVINEEESAGKKTGGVLTQLVNDIQVTCLPRNLPEFIEIDVAKLEVGDNIRLGDVTLPQGLSLVLQDDSELENAIVSMQAPTVEEVKESTEEADAEEATKESGADAEDQE
ncbi:50S ribosomal protein L25/general stress protein Ctc [Moraxella bovoculi]|uniref:50S ribosomal protein L25/general stress protein Ctc n=1 Tax=Moraxella bovoculi TaxID=386891 RepID=UPI000E358775|nr:50S ribosomal protein L25/general stress protein Ctc [Moraxella bovoculi]NSM10859.1 50S ribosomal protein L25/general stress protein Ctc [Moraxella bovoculi]